MVSFVQFYCLYIALRVKEGRKENTATESRKRYIQKKKRLNELQTNDPYLKQNENEITIEIALSGKMSFKNLC